MKHLILFLLISIISLGLNAQGDLLIVADSDCEIVIDGELIRSLIRSVPKKISLSDGDHLIQAKSLDKELNEIVHIEKGKQKVISLSFLKEKEVPVKNVTEVQKEKKSTKELFLPVADLTLSLAGEMNALANEDFTFDNQSDLYYAFEEGDIVAINGSILNKKGKFFITVVAYPEMTPVYSKQKLENLTNQQFPIYKKGIYIIRIGTSAFFDKKIHLKIKRQPDSPEKRNFNTRVAKRYRYQSVKIGEPATYFVNSTSNETFKGGTNEITIPISTPPNTVEWYYTISASRNEHEVKNNLKSTSLVQDLAKTLTTAEPTMAILNIGLNLLTSPPGSDYCDVYLLDYPNRNLFVNDLPCQFNIAGSRKNIKSAVVKVKGGLNGQFYLGVENNDTFHGIHIGLEIVAVVQETYLDYVD